MRSMILFSALVSMSILSADARGDATPCGNEPGHPHPNGGGFVSDTAKVDETAFVGKNARVCGHAKVKNEARITGNAMVGDNAEVLDFVTIRENASVTGFAVVRENSTISGNAVVTGEAQIASSLVREVEGPSISGNAIVQGRAKIYKNARIYGDALVEGGAKVKDDAQVYGKAKLKGDARVACYNHVSEDVTISTDEGGLCGSGRDMRTGQAQPQGESVPMDLPLASNERPAASQSQTLRSNQTTERPAASGIGI